ncbi:MAG TPA: hypothetical protein VGG06_09925 [Thermoanaerobaculia bacterium]|jgi:hypothetical protein
MCVVDVGHETKWQEASLLAVASALALGRQTEVTVEVHPRQVAADVRVAGEGETASGGPLQ